MQTSCWKVEENPHERTDYFVAFACLTTMSRLHANLRVRGRIVNIPCQSFSHTCEVFATSLLLHYPDDQAGSTHVFMLGNEALGPPAKTVARDLFENDCDAQCLR